MSSILARTRVKNKLNHVDEENVDWIELWKEYTGEEDPNCSNLTSCKGISNYIVGGHVYKVDENGKATESGVYYVVPLCQSCNSANNKDPFFVYSSKLVKESVLLSLRNKNNNN